MDRFQQLRKQIGPETDDRQLLKQMIAFAERMEKEAETIRRSHSQITFRTLGKITVAAYRTAAVLELAQLDIDEATQDKTAP